MEARLHRLGQRVLVRIQASGPDITAAQVSSFVDRLSLFHKGFSWGGTVSLVMIYPQMSRPDRHFGGRLVRLNVGLEEPQDLIEDLVRALEGLCAR